MISFPVTPRFCLDLSMLRGFVWSCLDVLRCCLNCSRSPWVTPWQAKLVIRLMRCHPHGCRHHTTGMRDLGYGRSDLLKCDALRREGWDRSRHVHASSDHCKDRVQSFKWLLICFIRLDSILSEFEWIREKLNDILSYIEWIWVNLNQTE